MSSVPPPGWDESPAPLAPAEARRDTPAWSSRGWRVTAPDGTVWHVRRRWMPRVRVRWPQRRVGNLAVARGIVYPPYDLVVTVAFVVFVLVAIPLLLLGLEFVLAGAVIAASLIGRTLFGQPWVIQATTTEPRQRQLVLEWEVPGWRRSQARIKQLLDEIAAGHDPRLTVGTLTLFSS
jgi:hypothetical protein